MKKLDKIDMEIEKFLNEHYSGNFEIKHYGDFKRHMDYIQQNYEENLLFLNSGCTFEEYNLIDSKGNKITAESNREKVLEALNIRLENDKRVIFDKLKKKENDYFQKPDYINTLIHNGLLLSDGKRVNSSLRDIACLVKCNKKTLVTWQELHENFLKRNGEKFSINYCENARDYANSL